MEVTMPSCLKSEFISSKYTPKQRMLNAYKSIFSDRYPVVPEFWCYYPAKVGINMIRMEREIPLWKALMGMCFSCDKKLGCENSTAKLEKMSDKQYRETTITKFAEREFRSVRIYDKDELSWWIEYMGLKKMKTLIFM